MPPSRGPPESSGSNAGNGSGTVGHRGFRRASMNSLITTSESLRTRFRGALLRPGQEGYEQPRRTWNGAIDRRPRLIARCAGAGDVQRAVAYARERDLPITVRGGGHSVMGHG